MRMDLQQDLTGTAHHQQTGSGSSVLYKWQKALIASMLATTAALSNAAIDVQVLNPNGSPAVDVIVFALADSGNYPASQSARIEIAQKDKLFQPYITVLQREDAIQFVNQDDFTHHIYSLSEGNRFSFKLKAGERQSLSLTEQTAAFEQVAMGCNIHDWMSGYMLILDTPYFARTDENGHTTLPIEMPDNYRLHIWHPTFSSADHTYSRTVTWPDISTVNWQLDEQLSTEQPQANDDDFDFLDEY